MIQTTSNLTVLITSFSFKKGLPQDSTDNGGGYIFDCRALPNPGTLEQYKTLTGMQLPVAEYLEQQPASHIFRKHVFALVDQSVTRYLERNFTNLMVNFGCTGGQHRSVYFAEQLAEYLSTKYGVAVTLIHREQNVKKNFPTKN